MIEYKYKTYTVTSDAVKASYVIYKGKNVVVTKLNGLTDQIEDMNIFERQVKLAEENFVFTKQAAAVWLRGIGLIEQADELESSDLEKVYDKYKSYFDIYMNTLLQAKSVELGEEVIPEQKI